MASFPFLRRPFALPSALRRGTKAYDLLAGAPLVLFYAVGANGKAQSLIEIFSKLDPEKLDLATVLTVLSDIAALSVALLFVVCVLLRPPPIARAGGLMPRIAAVVGTYMAVGLILLSPVTKASVGIVCLSLFLVLCGTSFALWAVFYLGRSVSLMAEARKLVTGGPYRFVRHPLYLGEQISIAGVLLPYLSPIAAFVFAVQIAFQFYRMRCEEEILAATFPEYADYAKRTWRVLPGLY
ncbi:MAG TPA: isoprenylcysteine carboxylmethyltransferase family protein [Acidobacteriaceae bacterium]|jgi:protein-S-isoprenylcysteine O-methyltransferase Ste14|nr:isoprenylcysteine carboxylmethyltransferase family protein [Acidobacteriaceae bacterium]